jgi:hypothetical protein
MRLFFYFTLPFLISACGERCQTYQERHQTRMEEKCKLLDPVLSEAGETLVTFACPTSYGLRVTGYTIKGESLCHHSRFHYRF